MSEAVHSLLLQEAQQEIATLRSDLYSTRRQAQERLQTISALNAEVERLRENVERCNGDLAQARQQLAIYEGIEVQLQAVREANAQLENSMNVAMQARKILEAELTDERARIRAVEQAKAELASERSRLQKAKDELAAQLRVAQRRASDAEQEQLQAEEEASALRHEVEALRSGMRAGSPHGAALHGRDHVAALLLERSQDAERSRASTLLETVNTALDAERARAASLLEALNASRAEALSAQQRLAEAERQLPQPRALVEEAVLLKAQLEAVRVRERERVSKDSHCLL